MRSTQIAHSGKRLTDRWPFVSGVRKTFTIIASHRIALPFDLDQSPWVKREKLLHDEELTITIIKNVNHMADPHGNVSTIANNNEYEVAESIIASTNTLLISEKADPSPTTWADIT